MHPLEPILYEGNSASLTTTVRTTAHTPSGSLSSTFTTGRMSRKTRNTSHTTSIITLPVVSTHSFPRRLDSTTADSTGQLPISPRQDKNKLRRWEVESVRSRLSTPTSEVEAALTRVSSPTSLFPGSPLSSHPPQLESPTKDFRASFTSVLPHIDSDEKVRIRSGPIIRKPTSSYVRPHAHKPSSSIEEHVDLIPPPQVYRRGDRPFFGGAIPQHKLRKQVAEPASVMNRLRGDSGECAGLLDCAIVELNNNPVNGKRDSRVLSALRDWGTAVFMEIDKTLEDTQSLTASPDKEYRSPRPSSASSMTYRIHDGYDQEAMGRRHSHFNDDKSVNPLPNRGTVTPGTIGKARETVVKKLPPLPPDPASLGRTPPAISNPFEPTRYAEDSIISLPSKGTLPRVSKSHSQRSTPEAPQQPPRPPSPHGSETRPPPRFSQRYARRFATAVE